MAESFCFDLADDQLTITETEDSTENSRRRLLSTEYEIVAGFEYNDDLQDFFFENDTLYNPTEFGEIFGEDW